MSGTNNPVASDRVVTRGGAKGKISKVMAILRSGGFAEDSDSPQQEDNKKAKKSKATKKTCTTKSTEEADTRVATASELAELEDAFLKKVEAGRSSHPRHWTDNVLGNGMFS
jgi:hypothetical protein